MENVAVDMNLAFLLRNEGSDLFLGELCLWVSMPVWKASPEE